MTTIVISIGRNRNDSPAPLTAADWESFITRVERVVLDSNGDVYGEARGRGEWDGNREDTFILIGDVHPTLIDNVKSRLAYLAWHYKQDAIGLTVHDVANFGDSLVEASVDG